MFGPSLVTVAPRVALFRSLSLFALPASSRNLGPSRAWQDTWPKRKRPSADGKAAEELGGKRAKEWSREIRYKRTPNRRPRWVGQSKRRELGQTTSEISYLAFSALSAGRLMRVALMDDHFRTRCREQASGEQEGCNRFSRISFSVQRRGIAPCPDREKLRVRI